MSDCQEVKFITWIYSTTNYNELGRYYFCPEKLRHPCRNGRLVRKNVQFAIMGNKTMWKYLSTFPIVFLSTPACTNQPTHPPTSTSMSLPSLEAHFPQVDIPMGNVDFLVRGKLALENGCLRVNKANLATGDSFLLIWNSNFAICKEQSQDCFVVPLLATTEYSEV